MSAAEKEETRKGDDKNDSESNFDLASTVLFSRKLYLQRTTTTKVNKVWTSRKCLNHDDTVRSQYAIRERS